MDIHKIYDAIRENNDDIFAAALMLEKEYSPFSTDELIYNMSKMWSTMCDSAKKGISSPVISNSKMTGGEGYKLYTNESGEYTHAAAIAMGVANVNSSMGKIVAAPTAGSCGILPGVFLTLKQRLGCDDEKITKSLFVAGLVGRYIAEHASIAGACHGCQAECGSASAMAAAAGVWLCGGTAKQSFDAAAMALKAIMGLVCDPAAGLVEVPCVKRNAFGAVQALLAIDMTLAGIESVIPFDETVMAMKEVGELMSENLRETSRGGIAVTKTAKSWEKKLFGEK